MSGPPKKLMIATIVYSLLGFVATLLKSSIPKHYHSSVGLVGLLAGVLLLIWMVISLVLSIRED